MVFRKSPKGREREQPAESSDCDFHRISKFSCAAVNWQATAVSKRPQTVCDPPFTIIRPLRHNSCEKLASPTARSDFDIDGNRLAQARERNTGYQRFMLAQLTLIMIETAFCTFSQSILRKSSPKSFRQSQKNRRATDRAQHGLNDTDFLKEFSCYE